MVLVVGESVAGKGGQSADSFCVNMTMPAQLAEGRVGCGKAIGTIEIGARAAHKDVVSSKRHEASARICHNQ